MASYIQFPTDDGTTVLVEVEEEEIVPRGSVTKAGALDKLKKNIAKANSKLEEAIQIAPCVGFAPTCRIENRYGPGLRAASAFLLALIHPFEVERALIRELRIQYPA